MSRICPGCETAIPAKRLRAKPDAAFCVSCQAQRDEYLSPHQVPGMAVMSDYDSTSDHFAARQGIEVHR